MSDSLKTLVLIEDSRTIAGYVSDRLSDVAKVRWFEAADEEAIAAAEQADLVVVDCVLASGESHLDRFDGCKAIVLSSLPAARIKSLCNLTAFNKRDLPAAIEAIRERLTGTT